MAREWPVMGILLCACLLAFLGNSKTSVSGGGAEPVNRNTVVGYGSEGPGGGISGYSTEIENIGRNAQGHYEIKVHKDGSVMVDMSQDAFLMGSDHPEAARNERPVHKVTIGSFWMDKHEVTVAQFRKFCEETGKEFPGQPEWNRDNHPIVNVSWKEAKAYCGWIGKRLPTEAEWEYAARGGLEGKDYPWGDTFECAMCNSGEPGCNGVHRTSPVGAYPPNDHGLHDMAGNVCEWCADRYDESYYSKSPDSDPQGPLSGLYRVFRGGAWNIAMQYHRVSSRIRYQEDGRFVTVGFRCAESMD